MKRFFACLLTLLILGCVSHPETDSDDLSVFECDTFEIKYAKGFEVIHGADFTKIITKSLPDNDFFRDSILLPHTANLPEGAIKFCNGPLRRACCQSLTHIAFLDKLQSVDCVNGLCAMDYVADEELYGRLVKNGVEEICNGEQIQSEILLKLAPDIFFMYPFGDAMQADFSEKGITTLLIAEYLEESQLARLEWIKLFGLLVGRADEATDYFDKVEADYLEMETTIGDGSPTFLMNLPYGDSWFMPSSRSVGVELIEDAGLTYLYSRDDGTENVPRSLEEVWGDGTVADWWIIIAERPAGFSMADLLAENEVYREFESVKRGDVLMCNTTEVDYFAKGVVEPDVILRDLRFHMSKGWMKHEPVYFFRLE